MRRLILLVFLISLAGPARAQVSPQIQGAGPPTNPCYNGGQQYVDQTNKVIYNCSVPGQNWVNIGLGNLTGSGSSAYSALTAGANTNTGTFSMSQPNTFTSAAMNEPYLFTSTGGVGCNPSTVINGALSTSFSLTDGLASCITPPTSGVTNAFSNALAGYAISDNGNSTGQNGWVGTVGVYGQSYVTASGARGWGMNQGCTTATSLTGAHCTGLEDDLVLNNNSDVGFGAVVSMLGGAGQPTGDNFPGYYLTSSGPKFTSGFECNAASVAAGGSSLYPCLHVGSITTTNPSNSMGLQFDTRNSGGTVISSSIAMVINGGDTTDGQFGFGQSPIQVTSVVSVGTQSISGCSLTSALGGPWAGSFHSGTSGTCTVTITMKTAANGFACHADDLTTPTDVLHQTGTLNTGTATISGTTVSGDLITYECFSF